MRLALLAVFGVLVALVAPGLATAGPGLIVGAVEDDVRASTLVEAEARMTEFRLSGFRAVRSRPSGRPGLTKPSDGELTVLRERRRRGRPERRSPVRDRHAPGLAHDAADGPGALGLRRLRRGDRARRTVDRARHHRQRAEPQPLLASAVRSRRGERRTRRLPGVARTHVRRPQGSVERGHRLRRSRLPARHRPSRRDSSHPLSDDVHPGHGSRVSCKRTHTTGDGRARDPRLRGQLERRSDRRPPARTPRSESRTTTSSSAFSARRSTGPAQPGSTLPILYGEYGVETQIPESKAGLYTGTEPTTTRPVSEETQASYYQQALALAFCQPNVAGMLLFLSPRRAGTRCLAVRNPLRRRNAQDEPDTCHQSARPHDGRLRDPLSRAGASGAYVVPPLRHALGGEARRLPRELQLRPRLPLLGAARERRHARDEARRERHGGGRRARAGRPRNAPAWSQGPTATRCGSSTP